MRVAAVQAAPVYLDARATTDKAIGLLREAARAGAELVVFPEVYVAGYPCWLRTPSVTDDDALRRVYGAYVESAIRADGAEMAALTDEAAKLGVFVYVGFVERAASGGSVYASLAAIHPDHGLLAVHRKLKPTLRERLIWSDGDGQGLRVHEWRGLHVGGLNCFENWMPLARYAMYEQGEQIHVATWPGDRSLTEDVSRFIAMEGRVYVVSASGLLRSSDLPADLPFRRSVVDGRSILHDGGSMIVAPGGEILAGPVVDEECILYADVDPGRVLAERLKLDPAGHYGRRDVLRLDVTRARRDAPR